jgi:nucleotide-binding universal stress UspA family protein
MYKNILVATGGSPWSDAAVAYAIAIAARTGGMLRILTVLINPGSYTTPDVMGGSDLVVEIIEHEGEGLLTRAALQAQQAGVSIEKVCHWGSVPETILQTAADLRCDLIVLGAHMVTGWKRLRLGHIANAVAVKAQQPVLVVKQPPSVAAGMPLGRRLLVATGGSPWSDMAVEHALTLAQMEHLTVCLLHVVAKRRWRGNDAAEEEGSAILARAEAWARDTGVSVTSILTHGEVAPTIVATAVQEYCDGIVLGSRGATGWKRLMLGSISNAVAVTTALPVLVVKRPVGI